MSRIAAVEVIPVASPGQAQNDLDGTLDTVIVRLTDEDGRTGIGEADAPPEAIKAFIEMPTAHLWSRNAAEILLGRDPVEIAGLWQKLYEGTFWPGRRGLGIHAISAIDIALHDLAGKQLGPAGLQAHGRRPAREAPALLHDLSRPGPGKAVSAELMTEIGRQFEAALALGFRAVKMEVLFFDLVTDAELVEADQARAAGCWATASSWRSTSVIAGTAGTMPLWVLDRIADCEHLFRRGDAPA